MTGLRATPLSIDQNIINNLDANMNAQAVTQEQLSTGYLVNQPSDNPAQIGEILYSNALLTRTAQYISNANDGVNFLTQANSIMNQVTQLLGEAKSAVTQLGGVATQMGSSGPPSQVALELQGIFTNLLGLANSSYLGTPIFGGSTGSSSAFDTSGNYLGNALALSRTVSPGISLQATVVGSTVFGGSAAGEIITASNNTFNMRFNAGPLTLITIPVGNYTAAGLATALQNQLNAAFGAGSINVSLNSANQLLLTASPGNNFSVAAGGSALGYLGLAASAGVTSETGTASLVSSVFGELSQLITDINAGNYTTAEQVDQIALDNAATQVNSQGAVVGALYQTMQTAQQLSTQTQTTLKNQISSLVDVNVAQTTTDLQQEQTTYQAALYGASQVNRYSLIQFVA